MGRHEIKLRRHRMTSGRIEGFRNYHEVLERHKKASRMRKVFKLALFLLFFVVILISTYFIFAKKEAKDNAAPKARTMTISRQSVFTPTVKGESRLEDLGEAPFRELKGVLSPAG